MSRVLEQEDVNMFGFTPCPKCQNWLRCEFYNKLGWVRCDACGYQEPKQVNVNAIASSHREDPDK